MTLAKPQEHMLSRKLRKLAATADEVDKPKLLSAAAQLDQTIGVLGIWKDPERIILTHAYSQALRRYEQYVQHHPTV